MRWMMRSSSALAASASTRVLLAATGASTAAAGKASGAGTVLWDPLLWPGAG